MPDTTWDGTERRHASRDIAERLEDGDTRMSALEGRLDAMERKIDSNTAIMQDIRDILETGKALFRIGSWLGKVTGWGAALVLAWAAWWGIRHTGGKQ